MDRPLEGYVERLIEFEGYAPLAYWCRGHQDKAEFRDEVMAEWGEHFLVERVLHGYARNVPVGRDRPGEMVIQLGVDPGRGAYPITFIDLLAIGGGK